MIKSERLQKYKKVKDGKKYPETKKERKKKYTERSIGELLNAIHNKDYSEDLKIQWSTARRHPLLRHARL